MLRHPARHEDDEVYENSRYRFTIDIEIDDSECDKPRIGWDIETLTDLAKRKFGSDVTIVAVRKLRPDEGSPNTVSERDTPEYKQQQAIRRERR